MLKVRSGQDPVRRRGPGGAHPGRAAAAGHQLRPPGPQHLPEDDGQRQPRARRGEPPRPVAHPPADGRDRLRPVPRAAQKANAQAGNLSGGEQKMLEIGRAMLLEPRLLLVDEPSVGLSPILVRQVFALLRDLRDRGVTVLMVEQNAKRALETSDYGMVLQQGRLALAGTRRRGARASRDRPPVPRRSDARGRRVSTPTALPGRPSPRDGHNVVLTGFMGTGKTTVGRLLADELGYEFVDTDELIEQRHGSIADIFATRGEEAFRQHRAGRRRRARPPQRPRHLDGRPDDARSRQRAAPSAPADASSAWSPPPRRCSSGSRAMPRASSDPCCRSPTRASGSSS